MSRIQKALMLAVLVVLVLIGPCVAGMAESGTGLNLPDALPDGSTMASVRDVFTEVADQTTAHELRSHMPHVLGGTEYRYVLEKDGQVEAEWGIVVFEFENEQVALEDFQHLANEVAFVNKNPRFVRIPGAENVPEIQEFLESDLEYACLMNEIVIFPQETWVIWVDDYGNVTSLDHKLETLWSNTFRESLTRVHAIMEMDLMPPRMSLGQSVDVPENLVASVISVDGQEAALVTTALSSDSPSVGDTYMLAVRIRPLEKWFIPHALSACVGVWPVVNIAKLCGVVMLGYDEDVTVVGDTVLASYRYVTGGYNNLTATASDLGILEALMKDIISVVVRLPIPYSTMEYFFETLCLFDDNSQPPSASAFDDINTYDHFVRAWPPQQLGGPPNGPQIHPQPGIHFPDYAELMFPVQFDTPGMHAIHVYVKLLLHPDIGLQSFHSIEMTLPVLVGSNNQPGQSVKRTPDGESLQSSAILVDGEEAACVKAKVLGAPSVGHTSLLEVEIHPSDGWYLPHVEAIQPFCDAKVGGEVVLGYDEDVAIVRDSIVMSYRHVGGEDISLNTEEADLGILEALGKDYVSIRINFPLNTLEYFIEELCCNRDQSQSPESTYFTDMGKYDKYIIAWPPQQSSDPPRELGVYKPSFARVAIPIRFERQGKYSLHLYIKVLLHPDSNTGSPALYSTEFELSVTVQSKPASPIEKALEWLRTKQNPENGSWDYFEHESVGITALATLGFLNAGYDASDQNIKHGLDYIVSKYNSTEGWISAEDVKRGNDEVLVYDTALAVLPLIFARHVDYTPPDGSPSLQAILKGAARYLVNQQSMDTSNPYSYGGWGYPRDNWADLSNTQWVLLALETIRREAGITAPMPNWTAAATFVARCWNTDGGFAYRPGGKSYGSMTGAGVWSLLICGWNGISTIQIAPGNSVALAEPLQRGLDWLSTKNEVRSNPGAESQWYYYYLVTVAKTYLFAEGNIGLDWYNDMASYLTKQLQKDDGRFPAVYEEEEPDVMATAEAVLALQTRAEPPEILQNTELWIVLASHADLHVYDSEGRHVGRNYETGLIDIEIPGASYRADGTQAIGISRPSAGRYRIELVGTSYGEYSLTVEGRRAGETISTKSFTGVIEEDVKHSTTATLTSIVGPLTVFVGKPRPLPEGLYAIPGDGQIELHWRSYTDPGFQLAGYNVYRSTRSGGGYTRVNASLISGTEHTDKRTKSWKTYYYVITAVDRSGNETGYSPEAEGIAFPQGLLESIVRLILGILQAILSLFGL